MFCFFFSSRRRHTRCYRDWSSDVCSSDLPALYAGGCFRQGCCRVDAYEPPSCNVSQPRRSRTSARPHGAGCQPHFLRERSEERRVGKECGSEWWEGEKRHEISVQEGGGMR